MAATLTHPRPELLQVADVVAREKSISRDEVLEAMEQAIQKAGRSKYGPLLDIRAAINRANGEVMLARYRTVVETVEDEANQLSLAQAHAIDPAKKVGESFVDPLPPIDFGRIAAQTAKQVIVQKVREAEREHQFEEFKDRAGQIIHGVVKRVEWSGIVVDLGRGEGVIRREDMIPRETFRQGDRVRAYIYDVRKETRGPQIFLSRTHPQFMAKLFAQEVPEIYDNIIEVKAVARDPGSRAKIAVISKDSSIDPVGACVGMRGSRVQAVVAELQGEKIDIIPWSPDIATFVVNALAPAEVTKVVLDEENATIEVIVPDEQQSLAIGRRGQNVRLASQLTGLHIEIMTEQAESERRQEEFRTRSALFMAALDVDEMVAQLLVTEGFRSVEDVAFVPVEELAGIESFNEEIAEELRNRAQAYLEKRDAELTEKRRALGVEDALAEVEDLPPARLVKLGEAGVKSVADLADLSSEELRLVLMENAPAVAPEEFVPLKDDKRAKVFGKAKVVDGKVVLTGELLNYLKPHRLTQALKGSPLNDKEAEAIVMSARRRIYGEEAMAKPEPAPTPATTAAAATAAARAAPGAAGA
jgi:transcription termination/antitermination protein NusA